MVCLRMSKKIKYVILVVLSFSMFIVSMTNEDEFGKNL